jgi:hypothetical protein
MALVPFHLLLSILFFTLRVVSFLSRLSTPKPLHTMMLLLLSLLAAPPATITFIAAIVIFMAVIIELWSR